jgi:hypothetical protein
MVTIEESEGTLQIFETLVNFNAYQGQNLLKLPLLEIHCSNIFVTSFLALVAAFVFDFAHVEVQVRAGVVLVLYLMHHKRVVIKEVNEVRQLPN